MTDELNKEWVLLQPQRTQYLEKTLQSATPAQLLIMLCDGAIRFNKQAIEAINQKNFEDANHYLGKVQDIIGEFVITLDQKSPVADHLLRLYDYFLVRLTEANIKKETEPAEEVLSYLLELKTTWMEASKLVQSQRSGATYA